MQEITEEEYLNALNKVEEFKEKLFKLRMEYSKTNDIDKKALIEEKIKLLKRENSRTGSIIKMYEFINKGRKR